MNKRTAEINLVNWKPGKNAWALRISYNDERFAVSRDSVRFGE